MTESMDDFETRRALTSLGEQGRHHDALLLGALLRKLDAVLDEIALLRAEIAATRPQKETVRPGGQVAEA